jgi:hypothetical protein
VNYGTITNFVSDDVGMNSVGSYSTMISTAFLACRRKADRPLPARRRHSSQQVDRS